MGLRTRGRRLDVVNLTGVAGVDFGANELEGFPILKALNGDPTALLKAAADLGLGVDALADSLTDASVITDLEPAQVDALHKALGQIIEAETDALTKAAMTAAERDALPADQFGYVEPDGTKHFPLSDAKHVRLALQLASTSPFGDKAMPKIKAAAKKFGIDADSDDVKKAAERLPNLIVLHKGLGQLLEDPKGQEGPPVADDKIEVEKAAYEALTKQVADLTKERDEAISKAAGKTDPPEDPIAKAAKDHPELAVIFAKQAADMEVLRKSAEDAAQIAKSEQAARVKSEFTAFAKSLGGGDEMAVALVKAFAAGPEVGNALVEAYRSRDAALSEANIFKAYGGDGEGQEPGSPEQELGGLMDIVKAAKAGGDKRPMHEIYAEELKKHSKAYDAYDRKVMAAS